MSGKRSAITASLFQVRFSDIVNISSDFAAWKKAGLTMVRTTGYKPLLHS
jgi:hypothetical protein